MSSEAEFDDDSERVDQLRAEWLEHPVSRELLQRMKEKVRNLKIEFEDACSASSDPKVRGAFREYKAMLHLGRSMEGKK